MEPISFEDILVTEVKILESSGKTLNTLHQHLKDKNKCSNLTILKQFNPKRVSLKMKKMFTTNIESTGDDSNANLRALSIILIKLIHSRIENEDILVSIKTYLYSQNFNLKLIIDIPKDFPYQTLQNLSNLEMKKILAQFFNLIKYPNHIEKLDVLIQKYPLAIELIVLIFRTMLFYLKFPQANQYHKKLSTTACFQILFDFLDIFYNKSGNIYLLREDNLYIQNGYENQANEFVPEIAIGSYYENKQIYKSIILKGAGHAEKKQQKKIKSSNRLLTKWDECEQDIQLKISMPQISTDLQINLNDKDKQNNVKSSKIISYNSFNLASNRSDVSFNHEQFENESPTPSFNVFQDQDNKNLLTSNSFRRDQNNNNRSKHSTLSFLNMKQSATIMYTRNEILKSSIFDDIVQTMEEKGSIQLTQNMMKELGVKNNSGNDGLNTNDTPTNPQFQFVDKQRNIIFPSFDEKDKKLTQIECTHSNQNNMQSKQQQKKTMKKSQSERNSFLKNNEDEQLFDESKSLFSIKCKKLKTSIQFDESYQGDNKINNLKNYNLLDAKQHNCQHSTSSCQCTIMKIRKNQIFSNVVSFRSIPEGQLKKSENNQQKQKRQIKKKQFRLNDDFFKNLKAKRELNKKQQTSKTKSQKPHKQLNNFQMKNIKHQTQYSQFIKIIGDPSITIKAQNQKINLMKKKFDFYFKSSTQMQKKQHNKLKNQQISNLTNIPNQQQKIGTLTTKNLHKQFKIIGQFQPKDFPYRSKFTLDQRPQINTEHLHFNRKNYQMVIKPGESTLEKYQAHFDPNNTPVLDNVYRKQLGRQNNFSPKSNLSYERKKVNNPHQTSKYFIQ